MDTHKQLYTKKQLNAEIAISGSATYGQDTSSTEAKSKFGSFNGFTINSLTANEFKVILDGVDTFVLFAGSGVITLKPNEGQFFDWITVTNLNAGAVITAEDLSISLNISKPI